MPKNSWKAAWPAAFALVLGACGNIPLGSVALPPVAVTVPVDFASPISITTPIIYIDQNQYAGQSLPSLVNAVDIDGTAEYQSKPLSTSDVQQVELFVRQSRDQLLQDCTQVTTYFVCGGDESANAIGSFDFSKSNPTTFRAGGPALLNALRAGSAYFGFRASGSKVNAGDQVLLTNLRAVGKF